MKKILVLSVIIAINVSSQASSQYKHLHRLPENSQIRRRCEVSKHDFLGAYEAEDFCDKLDFSYEYVKVDVKRWQKYGSKGCHELISSSKWKSAKAKDISDAGPDTYERCLPVINRMFPEMSEEDKKKECEAMAMLAGTVCRESFDTFEQAVLDSLTR